MLLTIDYLILNFKGSLAAQKHGLKIYSEDYSNPFTLLKHERGNKTFSEMYDLFYYDDKIGILNAVPHSSIIAADLVQLQFENHLFYTNELKDLSQLVLELVDYFALTLEGINRLDIALDKKENSIKYNDLYVDLVTGKKLIKGREKNISAHNITRKGRAQFNGFTIGKRSSSRFLRVYNKTEALKQPTQAKPYIDDYHKNNGLVASAGLDIWRFEYQLNNSFFTYLQKLGKNITYQIFEPDTLIQLIQMAEKNHFEIVYNTGKTETNKEKPFILHDWQVLYDRLKSKVEYCVTRIKKVFEPSIVVQKRLIKSLFRQYYICPTWAYLYPLTNLIKEYNLKDWFCGKYDFYIHEFKTKEKIKDTFNEYFFTKHFSLLTA